jgi:hypothetical protein
MVASVRDRYLRTIRVYRGIFRDQASCIQASHTVRDDLDGLSPVEVTCPSPIIKPSRMAFIYQHIGGSFN